MARRARVATASPVASAVAATGVLLVFDPLERDGAVPGCVSARPIACVPLGGREDERAIVGADGLLVRAVEERQVCVQIESAGAQIDRTGRVLPDDLDDAPGALHLRVALRSRPLADACVDLLLAEPPPELLAEAEEREPQVQGAVRTPLEPVGRADAAVLARTGREVFLEAVHRAGRVAGVEVDDGLLDGGRLAIERPGHVPAARRRERQK
jgi:hypothetical protein